MVKMPRKWRKDRGAYFTQQMDKAKTERSGLLDKRQKIRDLYFKEPGGFDANLPWDGASDIHLPIVLDKIETAVPKIMSAIWRAEPFVNVRNPDGVADEKKAKNVERFVSWAFRNDIPDFYMTWENFERNRLLDGTTFAKIRWERKRRRTIETHTVPSMLNPGDITITGETVEEPMERPLEDILADVFKFGDPANTFYDVKSKGKNKYLVKFTENGETFEGDVEIVPGRRIDEVDVRVKRVVVVHDSPVIETVDIEDILLPTRSKCAQSARWVAHKTWYTLAEVRKKRSDGDWVLTDEEYQTLAGLRRANDHESMSEQQKDKVIEEVPNTGTEITTTDKMFDTNRVAIWELYAEDYVDGDNELPMDVVMYIPDDIEVVIGIEYHDDLFPHGRRPFIHDTYIPVDGRIYGIGMAEILFGINLSLDRTINMINNSMEVKANPWAIYSAYGLAGSANALNGIKPGEWVPVGDVNAIKFPDFAQEPLALFHAGFETLRGYADSLTFSPSVGGSNNYRNAPRTARGTLALMDAAEEKLSSLVEQSQATAWKEMVRQVVSLYSAYIGIDKWYTVTGETKARRISPADLRNNWQYEYTGSLTSVNREVQKAQAERRYMALRVDPLYQNDPRAHQALLENYLKHMTDGDDYRGMVPNLPGEGGFTHAPMSQEQELRYMVEGVGMDALPVDDHMQHIKEIERFIQSDAFEVIPQYAVSVIHHHLKQHQQMMQQQQQMQQQAQAMQGGMPQQAPEPGAPVEGMPAMGGDMTMINGGGVG